MALLSATQDTANTFSTRVLAWFSQHGRTHLPWQQNISPYTTWVSEIMLQQTQVATVIPYFNRFITRFPDIITLADTHVDEVLALWAGLGYYSRARNLYKTAQIIRDKHCGVFPDHIDDVVALPGIGQSTAAAILSLSMGQHHAILDGNVKRVLSRHQLIDGIPNQSQTLKKQWAVATAFTPTADCDKYTQAMMDLGAMICTRSTPRCDDCPIYTDCGARLQHKIADYPNKKPKKILPEKTTLMLIITDGSRVYLQKRPDTGIWGGLWSLPESTLANIEQTLSPHSLTEISRQTLPVYTHTFTHYRLHITPMIIRVTTLKDGYTPEQYQQLGLPAPVKKILNDSLD